VGGRKRNDPSRTAVLIDAVEDAGPVRHQPLRREQLVDLHGRCIRDLAEQALKARSPGAAPVAGVEMKIFRRRGDGVEADLNEAMVR